ncbi:TetR/AcrR family transcriptional regulator [Pseudalkalibacillus sp. SCS-8]|uniref:TetR/AcrR family transcriptional regulator n=1 Tax=Pseudalkalibacillus nanhaiensis TaxID=3115291 RepID=UPI0032DA790C
MPDKNQSLSSRQKKSIQTRENLLHAAKLTFMEYGFQKTTITQIIKQADTGYGTAYVHFKNKDEILIELIEDVMEQFYKIAELPFRPETGEEAARKIQKQVRMFLEMARKEQRMLSIVEEAIGQSEDVHNKWKEIREKFIDRISDDIRYSQQCGLAYQDVDAEMVSRGWFYSNEMYLWEIVRNTPVSIDKVVHNLTTMYVRGLYR